MSMKQVTLRDPITNDILIPKTFGIEYEATEEVLTPPFVQNADTLGGNAPTYYAKQSDLDQCFQSVSEGKTLIAAAVTDKGVPTAAEASFAIIASNICNIATGFKIYTKENMSFSTNGGYLTITLPEGITWKDVKYLYMQSTPSGGWSDAVGVGYKTPDMSYIQYHSHGSYTTGFSPSDNDNIIKMQSGWSPCTVPIFCTILV